MEKRLKKTIDIEPASLKKRNDGQDLIVKNVYIGWLSQFVFLIAGFIIPRMIDNTMGQMALGIWDFSWTLIAYFGLIQGGVQSSVNRYVAKYKALGDNDNINISASSVGCVLLVMSIMVMVVTIFTVLLLPNFVGQKFGLYLNETQWVVFWLGASFAFQVVFTLFGGILSGFYRWDIHFYINVVSRISTLIGMVIVLLLEGGLVTLAMVYFCCEVFVLSLRVIFAYRVYPELSLKLSFVRWGRAKEMLRYGLKTYVPTIGELLTNQTMNLLIVIFCGPSVLAIYSRPRALIRNVRTFMNIHANVLTPTASAMHATKDNEAFKKLLIVASRDGAFFLFPIMIYLAISGEALIEVWMGKEYIYPNLFITMILVYLPALHRLPIAKVIAGANMHGMIGVVKLIGAAVGVAAAFITLKFFSMDLKWVVLSFGIPVWFSEGFYVSYYATRYFGMNMYKYMYESIVQPLLLLAPFTIILLLLRLFFSKNPLQEMLYSFFVGSVVLCLLYWNFVLPSTLKCKILQLGKKIFHYDH